METPNESNNRSDNKKSFNSQRWRRIDRDESHKNLFIVKVFVPSSTSLLSSYLSLSLSRIFLVALPWPEVTIPMLNRQSNECGCQAYTADQMQTFCLIKYIYKLAFEK